MKEVGRFDQQNPTNMWDKDCNKLCLPCQIIFYNFNLAFTKFLMLMVDKLIEENEN